MNRVCSLHNEYCPDGKCKWCEEPQAAPVEPIYLDLGAYTAVLKQFYSTTQADIWSAIYKEG
jgi:hypothetical protein